MFSPLPKWFVWFLWVVTVAAIVIPATILIFYKP
jgi:hypothetical protein